MQHNNGRSWDLAAAVISHDSLPECRQLLWGRGTAELFRGHILRSGADQAETCYAVSAQGRETLMFSNLMDACVYFWEITADRAATQSGGEDEKHIAIRRQ